MAPERLRIQDVALLHAIESGDLRSVEACLNIGANPNSRKLVTLKMTLETGEQVSDTRQAESALALAIRSGDVEIVKALLAKGASPNLPISWVIPNWIVWGVKWTRADWENDCWRDHDAAQFIGALCLSIASGGHDVSKPGGHVVLDNPTNRAQASDFVVFRPRVEITRALLAAGAKVTKTAIQISKNLASGEGYFDEDVDPVKDIHPLLVAHAAGKSGITVDVAYSAARARTITPPEENPRFAPSPALGDAQTGGLPRPVQAKPPSPVGYKPLPRVPTEPSATAANTAGSFAAIAWALGEQLKVSEDVEEQIATKPVDVAVDPEVLGKENAALRQKVEGLETQVKELQAEVKMLRERLAAA